MSRVLVCSEASGLANSITTELGRVGHVPTPRVSDSGPCSGRWQSVLFTSTIPATTTRGGNKCVQATWLHPRILPAVQRHTMTHGAGSKVGDRTDSLYSFEGLPGGCFYTVCANSKSPRYNTEGAFGQSVLTSTASWQRTIIELPASGLGVTTGHAVHGVFG